MGGPSGGVQFDATFTMSGLCTSDDIDIPGCTDATAVTSTRMRRQMTVLVTTRAARDAQILRLAITTLRRSRTTVHATSRAVQVAPDFLLQLHPNATIDDGSCILPYDIVYEDLDGDGIGGSIGIADVCELGPGFSLKQATVTTPTTQCTLEPLALLKASTMTAMASLMQTKPPEPLP